MCINKNLRVSGVQFIAVEGDMKTMKTLIEVNHNNYIFREKFLIFGLCNVAGRKINIKGVFP